MRRGASEAAGSVTVTEAGRPQAAQRGMHVAPGATVATGNGARAVIVRGRDFVTVAANSRVRVPVAAEKQGLVEMIQEWGNAIFQIEKQAKPHFGVRTPYLAAVVKGTTFSVTVTPQGASLQVIEGLVETSTIDGGAAELIRPGVVASVASNDVYRMTVQGQDKQQFDSPQRAAPPPAAAAGGQPTTPVAASTSPAVEHVPGALLLAATQNQTGTDQTYDSQTIGQPIFATTVDLGKVTDGLVTGSSAIQIKPPAES